MFLIEIHVIACSSTSSSSSSKLRHVAQLNENGTHGYEVGGTRGVPGEEGVRGWRERLKLTIPLGASLTVPRAQGLGGRI